MHKKKIDIGDKEQPIRQVLVKKEVMRIVKAYHEGSGGVHMEEIKNTKYYVTWVKELVTEYVFKCGKCQRASNKPTMHVPELHPVLVPEKVWSQV